MIADLMTTVQSLPRGTAHSIGSVLSAHMDLLPLADPTPPADGGGGGMIPNPPVQDPGGNISAAASKIVGYIKWGALYAILAGAFLGVILMAVGKWFSHEKSGRVGVIAVVTAIGAAVLYGAIYGLISLFV